MKLSKLFHKPEHIEKATEYDLLKGRDYFGGLALDFLNNNAQYYTMIEGNLKHFGLPSDKSAVEKAVTHIGYHYQEKFVSFGKEADFYRDFFKRVIKPDEVIDELLFNQDEYQPTIILTTHFGAMPFIVGTLNYCKLDISSIIKFPSEEFKNLHETKAKKIIKELGFGRIKFYEADKQPMMKVSGALEKGEIMFTVMDEHTPLSTKVNFLGKTITGGAGIDQMIDFVGKDKIKAYFSIMVRQGEDYKLELHPIDLNSAHYIQDMFTIYEKYVAQNYEQWFFLQEVHENIPGH